MVDLKIDYLAFTLCSRRYATILPGTSLGIVPVAMLLQSMHYAELVSCSFHDNLGTAVVVNNTNITLSGNTKFAHTKSCSNIAGGVGGVIMLIIAS